MLAAINNHFPSPVPILCVKVNVLKKTQTTYSLACYQETTVFCPEVTPVTENTVTKH